MADPASTDAAAPAAAPAVIEPIEEVAPGFYLIRTSFRTRLVLDIGTHMSLLRLANGRFLVVDTVELTPAARAAIDALTDGGALIDAVVAAHPFHTVYFKAFQDAYPAPHYYGLPRHLKKCTDVKWTGNLLDRLDQWEPDVSMRSPDGTDLVDPKPEYNHFAGLFVFHRPSSTLHIDDTLTVGDGLGFLPRLVLGVREGQIGFHPMLAGPGLLPDADAPSRFRCFLESIADDWRFENIAAAHRGFLKGRAHEHLRDTIARYLPTLEKMARNRTTIAKEDLDKFKAVWTPGHSECG
ncbi:hypothetical protein HK405_008477 [Cladochytrium tenue]|nr:hypothetical protein HK405_008477 [Cladochytrium tenue]